ncbi:hypothetical protein KII95_08610 [Leuconostoc gelidum subsp. aenigmaticum]|uniref:hypothetical protein n=1 Tax=Leuconostoc gelidum TaxID=1244 RepID=UPI001CC39FB6|nr:hypothetical protein [Leuconostoc gelidum]MBZ6004069.1 hypothetical protein [Leuconostoc gelidum subsp. aenigmaticum]
MSPDKIDEAIQQAVNNLKDEQIFTASSPDVIDLISKANIDAKTFAISLVQETMHQLFDDKD